METEVIKTLKYIKNYEKRDVYIVYTFINFNTYS